MSEIQVLERPAQAAPARDEGKARRVAVYCRVSTLQEEQADSYEMQCAHYRRLVAESPALVLADIYGDHGVSGLSAAERPAFQRMMADCMAGKVDVVMTKSVSRFARNLTDCVNSIQQLRQRGIPVLFEKEGLSSMDSGCEFVLCVLATLAQEEANNLSQSIRWSLEQRNASGEPARAARYGYRRARGEDGKTIWRVEEREARRVRLAFRMAARGESYRAIIGALDEMEIGEDGDARWTRARVRNMLRSEAYVGDVLTNKVFRPDYLKKRAVRNTGQRVQYYIEDHHEAIVDRETFARVGQLIAQGGLRAGKIGGRGVL